MKKYVSLLLCFLMIFSLAGCGGNSKEDTSTYTYSSELDIKNLDSSEADDQCSLRAIHTVIDGLRKQIKKEILRMVLRKAKKFQKMD